MEIISGDDLKKAADFVDGAGKTVEPLGDAAHNVLTDVGTELQGNFGRKARIVDFKTATFVNGADWTAGDDGSVTVHASVEPGGTTIDLPEPVEFIHFGKVYRDVSHLFPASKIDDTKTGSVLSQTANGSTSDIPAHGLMFRSALMRETVLLGGFIRAQMDALIAEEKSKGVVGVLAQVLADMTGSAGGTQDKPNAVDLNPYLQKVIAAGKKVNLAKIDYPTLHDAAIDLQTARQAYRAYLVSELEKREGKAKSPGGGILNDQVPKVNDSLSEGYKWWNVQDVVPKLTMIVPPGVQDFLSMVQKVSFKAWDVYASLIYEYSIRLEPIIEDSCANMTVDAIKKRSTPLYPVWFMAAQTFPALPANIDQQIFSDIDNPVPANALPAPLNALTGAINNALGVVTKPVHNEVEKYDQEVGIDKTLDFFSRPDAYTPGRPFLDDIFLVPPDPTEAKDLPNGDKRARRGWSSGLGDMAVQCMEGALGVKSLPSFIEWIVSHVSTVAAEFVRGVYCRLLTLKDTDNITEDEMIEAAEKHFVGNIIESILGGIRFVEGIRKEALDFPIGHVSLSIDALIGRAKEFASQKLDEFVAPVIKFAMRDLYTAIFAYRQTAITNKAMTMEVHLAELPNLFARLFRNIFFPLWDKVLEKVLDSVTASLMPKVQAAATAILHARDQVDQVRTKIVKGLAALDSLPKTLPNVSFDPMHPEQSIDKLKSDFSPSVSNAEQAYNKAGLKDPAAPPKDALETSFPLQQRVVEAEATAVTDTQIKTVHPNLKWATPPAKQAAPAANGAAKADATNPKNGPATPAASPPAPQQPLMQPYDYSAPLPAAPASQKIPPTGPLSQTPPFGQGPINPFAAKAPSPQQETTQQFQMPEGDHAGFLDPEETVDLPGSALSVLLPFQNSNAKKK